MDYSAYTAAPQPYQFFGLPHASVDAQVEDYRPLQSTEQYDPAFAAFQQSFHYDPTTFLAQPHHMPPQSSPKTNRHASIISIPEMDSNLFQPTETNSEEPPNGRSSSEEKETLTPQQSRRKAQNRAAQRAFRERKDKHVKDLEAKLTSLQHQSVTLNGENERLRREMAKIATENEILRATSSSQSGGRSPFLNDSEELAGPLGFVPTDPSFNINNCSSNDKHANLKSLTIDDESGELLLTAGATWDYIQAHELFRKGLVDVGDVCERLKKMARCDGHGPVFQERDVRHAIAESAVAGGRDELI